MPLMSTSLLVLLLLTCLQHTRGQQKPNCIKWKHNFEGVKSSNLRQECQLPDGRPVCCAATDEDPLSLSAGAGRACSRGVGAESCQLAEEEQEGCVVTREYVPSRYEQLHFRKAAELATIANFDDRLEALLQFLSSPEEVSLLLCVRAK